MKKTLCAILMMALLAACVPGALAEDELHELWGIPFGATADEVAEIVLEKTGLTLESSPSSISPNTTFFNADNIEGISICGFPVDYIWFQVSSELEQKDGTKIEVDPPQYVHVTISFEKCEYTGSAYVDMLDKTIEEGFGEYEKMVTQLAEMYGECDHIYTYKSGYDVESRRQLAESLAEAKSTTYEALLNREYDFIIIDAWFHNVKVTTSFFYHSMGGERVLQSMQIAYSFEEHTPYVIDDEDDEQEEALDFGLD